MFSPFLKLPRLQKQLIAIAVDYCLLTFAYWSAFALRFETMIPNATGYGWQMIMAPLFAIPVFVRLGLYRAVIRYMEDRVVYVVVGGVTLSVIMLAALIAMTHSTGLSRGVLMIYWALAILYVGSSRFMARGLFLHREYRVDDRKRVLIYGAGSAGTQLALALKTGREYLPVAFVDDKTELQGATLGGLVVHSSKVIDLVVNDLQVDEVLLAIPSALPARRAQILNQLEHLHCRLRIVPGMADVVGGAVNANSIREVEVDDLLGRDTVVANPELLCACITDKNVLVSGAGGSIGSELCRQIVRLKPKRLVMIEQSEFALYSIDQELEALCKRLNLSVELIPTLGSVMHRRRNEILMTSFGIHTVYHAAAYKHVPLVEHNPIEGIRNNVEGTRRMAEAAIASRVEAFVLISTDKAVRPTNVMGTSKRLSELVLQAFARCGTATRFCIVRFGNVLGSSGSVVPLFRKQIQAGGPITLTHPEITRYFMTIPEAAQLVIQAGSMGVNGEVFVLDMGNPVKIIDLAKRMIHLSGLELRDKEHPNGDIEIEIVGLRPGEKLYEELLIGDNVEGTQHPLIMRAFEHEVPWRELEGLLARLDEACREFDFMEVLAILKLAVREYKQQESEAVDLLWRSLRVANAAPKSVLH